MTSLRTLAGRTAVAAACAASAVTLTGTAATAAPNDAALARQGTASYQDASVITSNDRWFELFFPGTDRSCVSDASGGMGIHFVNKDRVGDGIVNASQPEAAIYEPTSNGGLRLVAVEYVVFADKWKGTTPPRLFNQDFTYVPADNPFDLPPFYELHAWVWKNNPAGMNAEMNPNVVCSRDSA